MFSTMAQQQQHPAAAHSPHRQYSALALADRLSVYNNSSRGNNSARLMRASSTSNGVTVALSPPPVVGIFQHNVASNDFIAPSASPSTAKRWATRTAATTMDGMVTERKLVVDSRRRAFKSAGKSRSLGNVEHNMWALSISPCNNYNNNNAGPYGVVTARSDSVCRNGRKTTAQMLPPKIQRRQQQQLQSQFNGNNSDADGLMLSTLTAAHHHQQQQQPVGRKSSDAICGGAKKHELMNGGTGTKKISAAINGNQTMTDTTTATTKATMTAGGGGGGGISAQAQHIIQFGLENARGDLSARVMSRMVHKRPDFALFCANMGADQWACFNDQFRQYLADVVCSLQSTEKIRHFSMAFGAQQVFWRTYGFKADFFAEMAGALTTECVFLDCAAHSSTEAIEAWAELVELMFSGVRDGYYSHVRHLRRANFSLGSANNTQHASEGSTVIRSGSGSGNGAGLGKMSQQHKNKKGSTSLEI